MSHLPTPVRVRPAPASAPGARRTVAWLAAAIGVAAQIAYPLSSGGVLDAVTLISVVAFFVAITAGSAHAVPAGRALGCAAFVLVAGWAVEALGVHTGFPFGRYEYTSALGGAVASVPLVVPFAWAGMCPIALAVGRRLGGGAGRVESVLIGAGLLMAWDIFLDPQMVADHRWRWTETGPHIPGIAGIPLSNFAGWLLAAAVLLAVLDRLLPDFGAPGVFDFVLCWIYFSQLLAAVAFFDRPMVGLIGGAVMGCFVVPYLRRAWR